jgi:hypothetical protein
VYGAAESTGLQASGGRRGERGDNETSKELRRRILSVTITKDLQYENYNFEFSFL